MSQETSADSTGELLQRAGYAESQAGADAVTDKLVSDLGFVLVARSNGSSPSRRLILEGGDVPHTLVASVDPPVSQDEGDVVYVSLSVYSPSNPALELKPTKVAVADAYDVLHTHVKAAKLTDTAVRTGIATMLSGDALSS